MRRLEREARKEKRQIAGLEGLGNQKEAIKEHRQALSAIRKKHTKLLMRSVSEWMRTDLVFIKAQKVQFRLKKVEKQR